ncbi:MAG TPA: ABC transporter substrate-binding protein [Acidimicrobiales bacterium]
MRGLAHTTLGAAALAGLMSCAQEDAGGAALDEPLPRSVPPGTELTVASPSGSIRLELELAGLLDDLPFTVPEWPNLAAGPDVINAFRANSLDLALNAGIPPIQAHYQGYDARIVAVAYHRRPLYVFATRPGSDVESVDDFRGRRLAFSQGQAQGVVLLRALQEAGVEHDEVELVDLTSNQFLTALQAGQVDVAPLANQQVPRYLDEYGADGARTIETDVVDLLAVLWAPTSVIAQDDKAAAIAAFIPRWAQADVWAYEHPDRWIEEYYVGTQNLSPEDGARIVELTSKPEFPPSWDEAIAWEQESLDLLAAGGFVDGFDAEVLFDRRFESLAADAVGDRYTAVDQPYEE